MKLSIQLDLIKKILPSIVKIEGDMVFEKEEIKTNILIKAIGQFLVIRSMQGSGGVEIKIKADIKKEGEVLIKKDMFNALISNSHGISIEIEADEKINILKIKTESSKSEIGVIKNFDYPELPKEDPKESEEVEVEKIISGINSASVAASKGVTRPQLSSVFLNIKENKLIVASTDGYRLIEYKTPITQTTKGIAVLIGVKNALRVSRSLETQRSLKVLLGEVAGGFVFLNENIKIFVTTIKKDFPKYEEMLKKKTDIKVELEKNKIVDFLRKASFFNNKKNKMNIFVEKNKITLSIRNEMCGSTAEEIEAITEGKFDLPAYNYKFILDAVRVVPEDRILLCFNENDKTLVIKGREETVQGLVAYQVN